MLRFPCPAATLILTLAALMIWDDPAGGEGALAVGEPGNVAEQGFAYGAQWNKGSDLEASSGALELCRTARIASKEVRALCKVVHRFQNECVAIALGHPHAGYAVAPNRRSAETLALTGCTELAGSDRRELCKVIVSECDGSAN